MSQWTLITACVGCGLPIVLEGEIGDGPTRMASHECRWCGVAQSITVGQRKVSGPKRPAARSATKKARAVANG